MRNKVMNCLAGAAVLFSLSVAPANAVPLVFTATGAGVSGHTLDAEAIFDVQGTELVVTLSNISTHTVGSAGELLTGLFFTLVGGPTLTPVGTNGAVLANSPVFGTASTVVGVPAGNATPASLGGEWAYKGGLNHHGARSGISSTGLSGVFSSSDIFGGPALVNNGGTAPDGPGYGIVSHGYNVGDGNGSIGGRGMIRDTVKFRLSGLPTGYQLTPGSLANVGFQYGTSLSETYLCAKGSYCVPEPSTAFLLGGGLLGFLWLRRRQVSPGSRKCGWRGVGISAWLDPR